MVQRNLREPSPKSGGLNKWLIGTALGGGVVFAVVMLSNGDAPPLMPEDAENASPVASSGASMADDLPDDYSHLFRPSPAVAVVSGPASEGDVAAPVVVPRPPEPPMAPVARCVRPPTTYAPGNLHQAGVDAMAYRDCLAERSHVFAMADYERKMADYAWEHGNGAGGTMVQQVGGTNGQTAFAPQPTNAASTSPGAPAVASPGAQTGGVQQASAGPRDRHEDFQARGAENTALFHAQEPEELPVDECVIMAGSKIPAVLLSGINTGAAGSVAAQVSYDVRDVRGDIAIPAGSRLVGRYDHITGHGQNRVGIAWEALTLPDFTTVSLAGLNGTDAGGTAGIPGDVNNHNAAFFGAVLLGSLVEAAPALAGLKADVSLGGVADDAGSAGQQIIERELKRQPTITVPAGTEVAVDVIKHLVMGECS